MFDFKIVPQNVSKRIDVALANSLNAYFNKVLHGFYDLEIEATLQLQMMKLLEEELNKATLNKNERFIVDVEKNIPLEHKKDEVDGVIDYYINGKLESLFLLEFKYKKPEHGGPNSCNIDAYVDIYELERQKMANPLVKGCYFVFVTSDEEFVMPGKKLTANRMIFPLHNGYKIQRREYLPAVNAALEQLKKSGYSKLEFENEHEINYHSFETIKGTKYWYFVINI